MNLKSFNIQVEWKYIIYEYVKYYYFSQQPYSIVEALNNIKTNCYCEILKIENCSLIWEIFIIAALLFEIVLRT